MINALAFRASRSTVYSLFCEQARRAPDAIAMQHDGEQLTYAELSDRVMNAAGRLTSAGVRAGDRVAILSENCLEYTQVQLAAARLGAIVACLNWRLSAPEIAYCIQLVEPKVLLVSRRFSALHKACGVAVPAPESLPDFLRVVPGHLAAPCPDVDPESGLLLLYTSGTTGHPKAALISHRAEIARMCALRLDLGLAASDAYIAWSPMFHMGGTEHTLATLMCGGTVVVVDGMKPDAIVDALAAHQVGWLLLVPASIEPVLECIERRGVVPRVRVVGCMADLVPGELIARTTQALRAPFLNSFGATETGMPPASADVIPVGAVPERLGKRLSSLCETRLVDAAGRDVAAGQPGAVVEQVFDLGLFLAVDRIFRPVAADQGLGVHDGHLLSHGGKRRHGQGVSFERPLCGRISERAAHCLHQHGPHGQLQASRCCRGVGEDGSGKELLPGRRPRDCNPQSE